MLLVLFVKSKITFVDGSLPCPDGVDPQLLRLWTRSNNIIVSWIYNSISKEIIASIMHSKVAADIWKDLQDQFQQKNGPRIFQLCHDLVSLT